MKHIIIFMGIPGSGKGTEAKKLAEEFGYVHISTGDLFRALALDPKADPNDLKLLEDMKAGRLVSDALVYKLAFQAIEHSLAEGHGVVLDGAIRSVEQAKAFEAFFEKKGLVGEVQVIELTLDDEMAYNRLTKRKICSECGAILPYSLDNEVRTVCQACGGKLVVRSDDSPEIARKRLEEQGNAMIKPIIAYYQTIGLWKAVDASKSIDEVHHEVVACLAEV